MSAAFALGGVARYLLADARVPLSLLAAKGLPADVEKLARVDLAIVDGGIAAIRPARGAPGGADAFAALPRLDLAGGIVLPLFVDAHTHLDKGHIWPRAPNPSGDFDGALAATSADRTANWRAEDVAARMEFSLRAAYAHGTRAIRTHLDSLGPQTDISWPVFAEVRERWRGRIALQAVPLFGIDHALDPEHLAAVERNIARHGSRLLGAVTFNVPQLREGLDIVFALAERRGWDLDFHVDESADPEARSLRLIAETAIRRKFAGRILAGHCCSLSLQGESEMRRTIALCAEAGLAVVSLPLCNLFLQDRHAGRTPRWRGVTALHELKAGGVATMIASDNTRDPFYAYGDLDMLEVWREGARILHLDTPADAWALAAFVDPARALGLDDGLVREGGPADLILTRARCYTELFARPHRDRTVLRAGRVTPDPPPPYADLDALEGLFP